MLRYYTPKKDSTRLIELRTAMMKLVAQIVAQNPTFKDLIATNKSTLKPKHPTIKSLNYVIWRDGIIGVIGNIST